MSANLLEIYGSVGGLAKAGAEQASAASARVAEVVQDGCRLMADSVAYQVNHSARALGAVSKCRSPEELAAAQREWLEGAVQRLADDFKGCLDLTGKLLNEVAAIKPAAEIEIAPVVVSAPAAPAVETAPAAPAVEPAPVIEEAPAVVEQAVVNVAPPVEQAVEIVEQAVEVLPVAEEAAPVIEAAPAMIEEAAPTAEEIVESAPAAEETPVVAAAPVAPVAAPAPKTPARSNRRGRAAEVSRSAKKVQEAAVSAE